MRSTVLFAVLGLILSACAAPEKAGPEPQQIPVETKVQPAPPSDDFANLPPVDMLPPERAMRNGLAGPDAPGPERLIGLAAVDIQKMLGSPDFKRHDPPAEIWQYRQDGCLLDIFLYQKGGGDGTYRVSHVEARGHSISRVSGAECLLEALAR